MSFSKGFGISPIFKVNFVFPLGMRGVEYMIVPLRSFKEVKLEEAGNFFQVSGTGFPYVFKVLFVSFNNSKAVHGDVVAHIC